MADPCFHALSDGRRIAYRHTPGGGPTVVFLPGYMSDMSGSKAAAIAEWAERLAPVFAAMNADPALHEYKVHPSRTGPYA